MYVYLYVIYTSLCMRICCLNGCVVCLYVYVCVIIIALCMCMCCLNAWVWMYVYAYVRVICVCKCAKKYVSAWTKLHAPNYRFEPRYRVKTLFNNKHKLEGRKCTLNTHKIINWRQSINMVEICIGIRICEWWPAHVGVMCAVRGMVCVLRAVLIVIVVCAWRMWRICGGWVC